ncbi:carboxymuconolactone decarboxylase family protein [uncultured Lutibacter sp.]|uniref:carboxymuconolactone decarboxylase family protein n=1 Tax=uncultured Lutibacter sp. TaxID=437739 RepID=UPI00262A1F99|nr:carboxymuconolactone decarboxylase family protein [uncultured Lutibacter sp.]
MVKDYCKHIRDLEKSYEKLEHYIPSIMEEVEKLRVDSTTEGILKSKTKNLIALGIAISKGIKQNIAFHVYKALESGASSLEIYETIGVAIYMGGTESIIYGCEAVEALNQFIVLEKNEK